ncbi:MAG: aminotransferase class III-fold pyridoxal phosphate-dependent enzyme, partial [Thermoleophilaceae bacterium]
KIELLERLLAPIAYLPYVKEVRQRGFMVGIEIDGFDPALRMGHRIALDARSRGAIIRPLGDVIVLMPPLAIEGSELQRLVSITRQSIEAATADSLPLAA